jgi:hypothetical protein
VAQPVFAVAQTVNKSNKTIGKLFVGELVFHTNKVVAGCLVDVALGHYEKPNWLRTPCFPPLPDCFKILRVFGFDTENSRTTFNKLALGKSVRQFPFVADQELEWKLKQ